MLCMASCTARKVRAYFGTQWCRSNWHSTVAFGVVCQLILNGADTAELDRYIELMLSVDLPVTFEQLGIPNVTDEEIRAVAHLSCAPGETIWNMETAINEDIVFNAIKGANAASVSYIKRTGFKKE